MDIKIPAEVDFYYRHFIILAGTPSSKDLFSSSSDTLLSGQAPLLGNINFISKIDYAYRLITFPAECMTV